MFNLKQAHKTLHFLLLGLVTASSSASAQAETDIAQEQVAVVDDCIVSDFTGTNSVAVLETSFRVQLREHTVIDGQCAQYVRAHVMGHVYFSGGAAASISSNGSLLRRSATRSSAKASEVVCDGINHSLTYATLVSPLRLIERRDAKYVGVFLSLIHI